jgi:hypothetical protein
MSKLHRRRHRSDHRDTQKKLRRILKIGWINFLLPGLLMLIISVGHKFFIAHLNLWILRGLTLIVIMWCCIGFFILSGGIMLWLRVKAG